MNQPARSPNFPFLGNDHPHLHRLAVQAEHFCFEHPDLCLTRLRQMAEAMAGSVAGATGGIPGNGESADLLELIRLLENRGVMSRDTSDVFHHLRREGNRAVHQQTGTRGDALRALKLGQRAAVWFMRIVGDPQFRQPAFIAPPAPDDANCDLRAELEESRAQFLAARAESESARQMVTDLAGRLALAEDEARNAYADMSAALELAQETEAELKAAQTAFMASPAVVSPAGAPSKDLLTRAAAANRSLQAELDESDTRLLIDAQLRAAGWEADTAALRYAKGTRPQKGRNLAIAEWPTESGPADYVLFAGLQPMAVVEAKRKTVDVSAALQQARRYSRGFRPSPEVVMPAGTWGAKGEYRLPFVYSTNGRPFLRQLETQSGIWFSDVRRPLNLSTALQGWHSPEGLVALLARDEAAAHRQLAGETFDFGFVLRGYQRSAILKTEECIAAGVRAILLAMATGTGKTKTCIALIYRLLKTKRFRRILFLVDRSALGEQAANAFKDTRMESLQTFADVFGIKELEEQIPDTATAVHIATVQGMVARVLYPSEDAQPPPVNQYDCIIVDECHRGYLLDRELSETELTFRSFDDYVSKYRRVLDWFDAVKIGLTATPALHTSEIFGPPVFTYSYREAVIDGFLVDHEPPVNICTRLSEEGIVWDAGAEVPVYNPSTAEVELFNTPDEIRLNVEDFNRRVITKDFNRVVCEALAAEIDPALPQKTLIFCANDQHADLVVELLKNAFQDKYGAVEDDAVLKITGAADKPLQLIRRFKNEALPGVAVTVDLLTTGVDVPAICNLVFLRRVNSRILYDQMLGRATRLCEEIGKSSFRIFDAVRIYEALQPFTAMKPVAVDPKIPFTQLAGELTRVTGEEALSLVRDQFLAKLQRRKRGLGEKATRDFETVAGMSPDEFIVHLRTLPLEEIAAWFTAHPALTEILDRRSDVPRDPVYISEHKDELIVAEAGYGRARKPEDYLRAFADFVNTRGNDIPALVTVVTRPRDLTRQQLRTLLLELDSAGFTETALATAWRQTTNREIAARIIGYIRQAALGDPLRPLSERVDHALQTILASRQWTTPQREWLKKLAAQTTANLLVDRQAIEQDYVFTQVGGFTRANKLFDGQLPQILSQFNDSIWPQRVGGE